MQTIVYKKELTEEEMKVYEASFDEEKMKALLEKVKTEANHVVHYDYKGHYGPLDRLKAPSSAEIASISNYKKTLLEDESMSPIYHFEYDKCYYPYLTSLLEKLLKGDAKVVEEILNPTYQREHIPIFSSIKEKEKAYQESTDVVQKIKLLDELKEMLILVNKGEYDIPIKKYYDEARELFYLEEKVLEEEKEAHINR